MTSLLYNAFVERIKLQNLQTFVRRVLGRIPHKTCGAVVLALSGELGSGKTTFVQMLARELGVTDTVQSPTYVLMKKYQTTNPVFSTLVHIDAYRLERPEEFKALEPEKFLHDPASLVVIEWPERVAGELPTPDLTLRFSSSGAGEGERYIEVV
jgi:tRNA threonylcarbamoyladenosine biosynthesis protein TsaE